jgi:hypothetical protein
MRATPPYRYLRDRIQVVDGCWIWTGPISHEGYGRASRGGRNTRVPAHRFVWSLLCRSPAGDHLHHVCPNRACVNPGHLRPVSASEHRLEHVAMHTVCRNGHAYDEANTYLWSGEKYTFRRCRACHRNAELRRYHRIRAAA